MFNLSPQLWNGAPTSFLTFTSSNATITPAITLSGDGPCQWEVTEADGTKYYYSANSFSHTRSVAGNMTVRLLNTMQVAPYVTAVAFAIDGIISSLSSLRLKLFTNISTITLNNNSLTGALTDAPLTPGVSIVFLGSNMLSEDVTDLVLSNTLTRLSIGGNSLRGNWSGKVLPSVMTNFLIGINSFTGFPTVPNPTPITQFVADSQGATNMTQPRIDAFVTAWYTKWVAGAFSANCTVNIGGTNANPSGIYQNPLPNPPATPLEMVYVMVNDPFGTGNKTQVWTY